MGEFSAYGKNSMLVQELVDKDKNAKGFFEESFPKHVYYIDEIEYILNNYKKIFSLNQPIIIATTIILRDPEHRVTRQSTNQKHSILLIWDGKSTIYFYDPNGNYTFMGDKAVNYSLGYTLYINKTYKNINSTEQLQEILRDKTKKTIKIPTKDGIQYVDKTDETSDYINAGGYCMFYNWLVIQYFIEQPVETWEKVYIEVIEPNSIFWKKKIGKIKINLRSKEIIDHWVSRLNIFAKGSKHIRKRRRSKRRRKRSIRKRRRSKRRRKRSIRKRRRSKRRRRHRKRK